MSRKEAALLQRRRRDARRQVEFRTASLSAALDCDENPITIRSLLGDLESALKSLEDVQGDYSLILDDLAYEADATEAFEFRQKCLLQRQRALC